MSRRRKRNKQQAEKAEEVLEQISDRLNANEPTSSQEELPDQAQPVDELSDLETPHTQAEEPPSSPPLVDDKIKDSHSLDSGELESSDKLPTSAQKREPRSLRTNQSSEEEQSSTPRRERLKKSTPRRPIQPKDELDTLDEEPVHLEQVDPLGAPIDKTSLTAEVDAFAEPLDDQSIESLKDEIASQSENLISEELPQKDSSDKITLSWNELFQSKLSTLSLFEKGSLAALFLLLIISSFWITSVVTAQIPAFETSAKVKLPHKSELLSITNIETYWRAPVREGESRDVGVSSNISLIPVARLALGPETKAQSIRLLFRDENGEFVGDPSTLRLSADQFQATKEPNAKIKKNEVTVNSTSGFLHEGEIISYLSDTNFEWQLVVFESQDGQNYQELLSIPISANRKDL